MFEAERKVCPAVFSVFFSVHPAARLWPAVPCFQKNCAACSQVPQNLQFPSSAKLQEVLKYLTENASLWVVFWRNCSAGKGEFWGLKRDLNCFCRQMKSPAITTTLEGKNKTLYLQVKCSLEAITKAVFSTQLALYWQAFWSFSFFFFFLMSLLCWD